MENQMALAARIKTLEDEVQKLKDMQKNKFGSKIHYRQ